MLHIDRVADQEFDARFKRQLGRARRTRLIFRTESTAMDTADPHSLLLDLLQRQSETAKYLSRCLCHIFKAQQHDDDHASKSSGYSPATHPGTIAS